MATTIEPLDINDPNSIADWHVRFSQYVLTNKRIPVANQTAFYLTLIGKQAFALLKDLAYPKYITKLDVLDLTKLLEAHVKPVNYEIAEREKFNNMMKRTEESYKDYVLRVQRQAANCNFTDLEIQLRDRLVAGIKDQELKRKLLKDAKLDFQAAKSLLLEWDAI